MFIFFFKQKTAYEMRISDWSSDVCSSDLRAGATHRSVVPAAMRAASRPTSRRRPAPGPPLRRSKDARRRAAPTYGWHGSTRDPRPAACAPRSEEHTSELQSLMRISYAVFCLKKKTNNHTYPTKQTTK